MHTDKNIRVFFVLLRAGLWEKEARLAQYNDIDYAAIMQIAEEQSVVGLITAGLEQVKDVKIPQEWTLQLIGATLQIEQKNKAMNEFVAKLIEMLRKKDVYTLLIKGQGIAQCYEKPLWRNSGDIDLFLSKDNYEKAKAVLIPLAQTVDTEYKSKKHLALNINNWDVELHGTLRCKFWKRLDEEIDDVQYDIFFNGSVRAWDNGRTVVYLPSANNDAFLIFTHILQHFYKGGIGLRQICDWCRLLWYYKDSLDISLLKKRLGRAGIMSEWESFAYLAVDILGMPEEAMPLYDNKTKWKKRSHKILSYVLKMGNFGNNREVNTREGQSYMMKKIQSFIMHTSDNLHNFSPC